MAEFQKHFWLSHCEAYIKDFLAYFDSGKTNNDTKFFKEKIIMCLHIINRRADNADDLIENGAHAYKGFSISPEEMNFLGKDSYPLTYIKYIRKEEWYLNILRHFPALRNS
jgi:hypothetical protein